MSSAEAGRRMVRAFGIFGNTERKGESPMAEFLIVNPSKRKGSRTGRPTARKRFNPAAGVLLSMANPKKHRTAAQKAATRRMLAARTHHNPAIKVVTRYRNKGHKAAAKRRHNPARRSRNPLTVAGFGMKQILQVSVGAFGGAMATRKLTSVILKGGSNEGFVGYLTNGAIALGLGMLGARWVNPVFGGGVIAGGVGTIWQRFYDENIGKLRSVAAHAISGGTSDGKGMGDISYDEHPARALEGYYNATYMPRQEIEGDLGSGLPSLAIPGPVLAHHMAM